MVSRTRPYSNRLTLTIDRRNEGISGIGIEALTIKTGAADMLVRIRGTDNKEGPCYDSSILIP